jgi:hypothetical protein
VPKKTKNAAPSPTPHSALRTPHCKYPAPPPEQINPLDGILLEGPGTPASGPAIPSAPDPVIPEATPDQLSGSSTVNRQSQIPADSALESSLHLIYEASAHGLWLYHNNCLAIMDAIAAKYPEGRFDMIFADPPYFLLRA